MYIEVLRVDTALWLFKYKNKHRKQEKTVFGYTEIGIQISQGTRMIQTSKIRI